MKRTLYSIISNIARRFLSVILGVVLIPVYIKFLGIESYGLVGFYATLIGSLALFDLGMSNTLNRELARITALHQSPVHARNLVYSLEIIYWGISIVLGVTILLLSPVIAKYWVNGEKLSFDQVSSAVMLMGGVFVMEWPISFYTGGLYGLQRQVQFNIVSAAISILKNVGVILVLTWVSSSIKAFFVWQMCMSCLLAIILRYLLWKSLPASEERARFSIIEVKKIWRFAAGMTAISLATFCLTRIDKVILSKILSLEYFGYYTFAWNVASGIMLLTATISSSLFPGLSGIVARKDKDGIVTAYHRFFRFIVIAVIPVGLLLCFFSKEILLFWTKNPTLAEKVWLPATILTAGCICNSMMHIPYYLMLAHGRTRFTVHQNIIASILVVPLLFWWTRQFGLVGAAMVWLTVNVGYVVLSLPLMHRKLLKGEIGKVYLHDIGIPFLISLAIIGIFKLLLIKVHLRLEFYILVLLVALAMTYFVLIFLNKEYRIYIRNTFASLSVRLSRYTT